MQTHSENQDDQGWSLFFCHVMDADHLSDDEAEAFLQCYDDVAELQVEVPERVLI